MNCDHPNILFILEFSQGQDGMSGPPGPPGPPGEKVNFLNQILTAF